MRSLNHHTDQSNTRQPKTEWTAAFVEWTNHEGSFHVNANDIVGTCPCKDPPSIHVGGISIGGRDASSHSLKDAISSLEIYVVGKTRDGGLPDSLMNLIISRQMISNDNNEPPVKKKKKV